MELRLTIGPRLEEVDYPSNFFDAIAFSHTHFRKSKEIFHQKLKSAIPKKGGILILELLGKKHLNYQKDNPNAGRSKR